MDDEIKLALESIKMTLEQKLQLEIPPQASVNMQEDTLAMWSWIVSLQRRRKAMWPKWMNYSATC